MFNRKITALLLLLLFVLTLCLSGCSNKEKVKDKSIKLRMTAFQYSNKKDTFIGIYSGEVDKDGYPDGDGKYVAEKSTNDTDNNNIHWSHKFTLDGNFSQGVFTEGKMIFTDTGKAIEGKFTNGKLNGEGKILFKDGSVQYKGAFHDNYPIDLKSAKPDYVVSYNELRDEFIRNNHNFTSLTKEFRDKYDQYVIVEIKGPVFEVVINKEYGNQYVLANKDALKETNIFYMLNKLSPINIACAKENGNIQICKDDIITVRTFGELILPPLLPNLKDPTNELFKKLVIDNSMSFGTQTIPNKATIVKCEF